MKRETIRLNQLLKEKYELTEQLRKIEERIDRLMLSDWVS